MRKRTIDLVFANEDELKSLYQTADFNTALKRPRADAKLGVVTRSEKGCVIATHDGVTSAPASQFESWSTRRAPAIYSPQASCRTGAGCDPRGVWPLGAIAAAEVIQHIGALDRRCR